MFGSNPLSPQRYHQVGKQAQKYEHLQPITNHKEVAIESNMVKVMEFVGTEASTLPPPDFYGVVPVIKETHPEFAKEYLLLRQPTPKPAAEKKKPPAEPPLAPPPRVLPPVAEKVPLLRRIPFQTGRTWPMAPDGYIPNSVIRAQLFPKGTPEALQCTVVTTRYALPMRKMVKVQLPEWEKDDLLAVERFRKKKTQRLKVTSGSPLGAGLHRDLLTEIVSKPWLRHKPSEVTLPSITKAILALMDDVPYSTYMLCTAALVQMSEAYELPPAIREEAFNRLMQDTNHKEVSTGGTLSRGGGGWRYADTPLLSQSLSKQQGRGWRLEEGLGLRMAQERAKEEPQVASSSSAAKWEHCTTLPSYRPRYLPGQQSIFSHFLSVLMQFVETAHDAFS